MEFGDHSHKSKVELLMEDRYSPEELATLLDMNVNVIRDACHEGDLKSRIVNHDIVSIERKDVLAWLDSR